MLVVSAPRPASPLLAGLLLAALFSTSASATDVSGDVSGVWEPGGSPYVVVGDVTVASGSSLTIEPGVTVMSSGHYMFVVNGALFAAGTPADPIVFTRLDDTDESRGWSLLRFVDADDYESVLRHTVLEYGYADDGVWNAANEDRGGGIFVQHSAVLIEDSLIRFNEASTGAGIYISNGPGIPATVRRNVIYGNAAVDSGFNACGGGGIHIHSGGDSVVAYNNLIYGNSYSGNTANYEGGGGVALYGTDAAVIHNTIWGNTADKGSGMHILPFTSSAAHVENNIVWQNVGSWNGEQISVEVDYFPGGTISPNLVVHNNIIDAEGIKKLYRNEFEEIYEGTDNRQEDPLLIDPSGGDFHLAEDSAAIDAADETFFPVDTDFYNMERYDAPVADTGSGVPPYADIGAIEWLGSLWSVSIDVRPGRFPNPVNPHSRGLIPVAIITTSDFDATAVDPRTVTFGPEGAEIAHHRGHVQDVDGDGDRDLLLHFRTRQTGIRCGDTEVLLTGATFAGDLIEGSDSIKTVGCR